MTPDSRFRRRAVGQKAAARGALGRAGDLDAGIRRSLLLAGQCRDRADGSPLMLLSTLGAAYQEYSGRRARLADARRAQGRRSARGRARDADGHARRQPARKTRARRLSARAIRTPSCLRALPTSPFYRMDVARAHLVAGFGRIVDLAAGGCSYRPYPDAQALIEAEADAHRAYECRPCRGLPALRDQTAGAADGRLALRRHRSGGHRIAAGSHAALRLAFPQRVTGPGPLRAVLKALAEQARGR